MVVKFLNPNEAGLLDDGFSGKSSQCDLHLVIHINKSSANIVKQSVSSKVNFKS